MKAAIFINEGTTQVVLSPENEWERQALRMIANSAGQQTQTFWAKFAECQGGWYRQWEAYNAYDSSPKEDASLIFRIDKKTELHDIRVASEAP